MQGASVCLKGHRELAGVGDFDNVGSDVTKNDVTEVQDVLRKLRSEMVNESSL